MRACNRLAVLLAILPLLVSCGGEGVLAPVVDARCAAEQSLSFDYEGDVSGFFCAAGAFPTSWGDPFEHVWAHAATFSEYGRYLAVYGNLPEPGGAGRHIQMDMAERDGGWSGSFPVTGRGMNWFSIRTASGAGEIFMLEEGSIVLAGRIRGRNGETVWGTFTAVGRTGPFHGQPERRVVRISNGRFHLRVTYGG